MNTYLDASTEAYAEYQKQFTPDLMRDIKKFGPVFDEKRAIENRIFSDLTLCQAQYYKALQ